ncbi:hypothetical protein SLEP1_g22800 [Rubroshorea leprosula]|uniref:LAGLIDADG homing endonuclease n=1 Tax=Rubroshorea leprosula TaxID=152421 RepID=A0AAV5JJ51_9ROSI|nr:hypothetical protein SLEP1_g22800 [Rubroshorea leprosula]
MVTPLGRSFRASFHFALFQRYNIFDIPSQLFTSNKGFWPRLSRASHITNGNYEPGQDDGREVQQPCPSTDVFNISCKESLTPALRLWSKYLGLAQGSTKDHSASHQFANSTHRAGFLQYDVRKGNTIEHVSKFLDAMGLTLVIKTCAYVSFPNPFSIELIQGTLLCFQPMSVLRENNYFAQSRLYWEVNSEPKEKKTTAHTLVVYVCGQGQDQWITDGAITLPQLLREPSDDDKCNPKYYRYHYFVHHSTMDCFSLRIHHHRAMEGLLEVPNRSASIVEFLDDAPNLFVCALQRTPKFKRRIVRSTLSTVGFGNNSEHAHGYIQLGLKTKTHFVEITFYDEFAPFGKVTVSHSSGTTLPTWNNIKDNPNLDLRIVLEYKRCTRPLGHVWVGLIVSSLTMPFNHLFFALKKDPLTDERFFFNEVECHTLEAGNKIFTEHLEFSSEANHLITLAKLPTLHEAQSTLTSLESSEAADLGDDLANPRHVHISTALSVEERAKMIDLLR